jgi:hypothetical protein
MKPRNYDADTQSFLTAASISDHTIGDAVDLLVKGLKAAGIWTKCKAIYPFVGGAATPHSYNLKNTAAFQITWNGTVTHNANGITPNGSTGYGNTGLNGSSQSLNNDSHLSTYIRNNSSGDMAEIGCYTEPPFWMIKARETNDKIFVGSYWYTTNGFINVSNTDSRGMLVESRTSSSLATAYRNGSSLGTATTTTPAIPNGNVCIGMRGTFSPASFSSRNQAFASIGQGLTSTEVANYYTIVQAFQTMLGRQV